MPLLHRERGYVFRFQAVDRGEPPHVHVVSESGMAKIWLLPRVRLASARGYTRHEIGEIVAITKRQQSAFVSSWYVFFAR